MFRRIALSTSAVAVPVGARFYSPPKDLQELFETDFTTGKFPIALVPSDTNLFAQFLFKAAEPKNQFDAILKDINTVQTAKLPVFWERTADVETMKEFSSVNPATKFTMVWMQKNGLLGSFNDVAIAFETLVNAQRKKHVVKVYVGDAKADTKAAQADAKQMQAGTSFEGFNLSFETVVDSSIVKGYNVEAFGKFLNKAQGADSGRGSASGPTDYTAVPAVNYPKTLLPENIEGEVLGRYFESLAQFDAEEAKNGV